MIVKQVIRKDAKNVAVYFDNDEKLILSEDVFFNSGLRKSDSVPEDRFSFFIEQNKIYYIKLRALALLGRRFHSERELFLKLKSKSYDEKLINYVLNDLKDKSFINDHTFAKYFIEEKLRKKKWGINKIRAALFKRGVSAVIIEELISSYHTKQNGVELAFELAKKKLELIYKRETDERKLYGKINSFLLSRGFDYTIAGEVCRKIFKKDFDEDV